MALALSRNSSSIIRRSASTVVVVLNVDYAVIVIFGCIQATETISVF